MVKEERGRERKAEGEKRGKLEDKRVRKESK